MAKSMKTDPAWTDLALADISGTDSPSASGHGLIEEGGSTSEIAEFAEYRVEDWVYARPVSLEGGTAYAVYAADGTFLEMVYSRGEVIVAAHEFDMEVVTVH